MYKILIVDDEPMVIHGLCRQIDWESYSLVLAGTAESGESALSILEEREVDILFTDVCMPKMNGLALISAAKKQNPFLRSVVISAHSEFDYVKKALLLGVENYLLKPINQDELDKTLEKTIDNLDRDHISIHKDEPGPSEFKSNILDRWVNASIQDYEFYERAELLHINLSAQQYEVCVIDIIDAETASQKLLYAKLVLEKCQSRFFPAFDGECFIDRCSRVVLVIYSDELGNKQEELERLFEQLITDDLSSKIQIFASMSLISDGVEGVAHHYADAVEYLNYRLIDSGLDYIFCGNFWQKYNSYGCEPILVQFTKAFSEDDLVQISHAVKMLFDRCSEASLEVVKQCLTPFLIMLVKQMKESGHLSDVLPVTATKGFEALNAISTITELKIWFLDIISQSLEEMGKRKTQLHLLVQSTLDIIRKDYHHTDLSLKTIAASINVSPAYLGQLFREATGKYFSDYLTETRLRASCILLLETDLKIKEILYRIGIQNQSYYNRIFKKAYGLTPLTFRYKKKLPNSLSP